MKILVYDTHSYDRDFLEAANAGQHQHQLTFTQAQLDLHTAALADGFEVICLFVNDQASAPVLEKLASYGVKLITLRCTGFNNVDLPTATRLGISVMRVSNYSPYAVAEHAIALLQTLNRHTHRAYNRTREFNFRLAGLMGRDIHGRTVGVVGTGKIGFAFASIMKGFGCSLLGYDVAQNPECVALGMTYLPLNDLLKQADIISLHVPLLPQTHHLINSETLALMKPGVFLINTSRGGLIDTEALLAALLAGKLAGVGLDVYEEEEGKFFKDLSHQIMPDSTLARLMTFPNVIVTGHQAFFTEEAVTTIAETTIRNINDFLAGTSNENMLKAR